MKSKKIAGLLLAGAILTGATAYGSYAWFTDEATTDANITIAMGNLDIEIEEPEDDEQWWIKEGSESNDESWSPTDWYSNIRPGDSFTRTITVVNNGSLAADTNITVADLSEIEIADGIKFDQVFELTAEGTGDVKLDKEESVKLVLHLAVKEDLGNELNANNGSDDLFEFNFDELLKETKFVTVTAKQINAE